MGVAKRMNTNEKGICFAREIKFISRLQGNALAFPRVPWASEKGTDHGEEKGGQGTACGGWGRVSFMAALLGRLEPCSLPLFVQKASVGSKLWNLVPCLLASLAAPGL